MSAMRPSTFAHIMNLYACVPPCELEAFDLMAINGRNTDIPKFKDHASVLTLCGHFVPVHRMRVSEKSTEVVTDEATGEDIWIVGDRTMLRSEMLRLAREYADKPRKFRR